MKNYYALLMLDLIAGSLGPGRVALLEDTIPDNMTVRDLLDGMTLDRRISVVSVTVFLDLLGYGGHFRRPVQVVIL